MERELTEAEGATARRKRNWVATQSKLRKTLDFDLILLNIGRNKWSNFSSSNKKLTSYVRGFKQLTHKTHMHSNLTQFAHDNELDFSKWLPHAFIIGKKDDNEQREALRATEDGKKWIVKRDDGAWGTHMLVTDSVEEVFSFTQAKTNELVEKRKAKEAEQEKEKAENEKENNDNEPRNENDHEESKEEDTEKGTRSRKSSLAGLKAMRKKHWSKNMLSIPWLVQEYLDDPFLINGRKFDVRYWVLLTHDYRIYVHKEGVCRLCSVPYDPDNLKDQFAHLTNHHLQEQHPDFNGNEIFFPELDEYLKSQNTPWGLQDTIMPQLQHIAKETILAMKELWVTEEQFSYQFFGFDVLIEQDGNVKLLEVNGSPAIAEHLLADMVSDIVELAIDPLHPPAGFGPDSPPSEENGFQLVHNSDTA